MRRETNGAGSAVGRRYGGVRYVSGSAVVEEVFDHRLFAHDFFDNGGGIGWSFKVPRVSLVG